MHQFASGIVQPERVLVLSKQPTVEGPSKELADFSCRLIPVDGTIPVGSPAGLPVVCQRCLETSLPWRILFRWDPATQPDSCPTCLATLL